MRRRSTFVGILASLAFSVAAFGQADPNQPLDPNDPRYLIQQMAQQFQQRVQETGVDPRQMIRDQLQQGTLDPQQLQQQLIQGGFIDQNTLGQLGQRVQQYGSQQQIMTLIGQLACSQEEWNVLGPKIQKVLSLMVEVRIGTNTNSRGGQVLAALGGNSNQIMGVTAPPNNPVSKALADMTAALQDPQTPDPVLARCLNTFRTEVEKAKLDLAAARKDLTEVSTVRQESVLLVVGILE